MLCVAALAILVPSDELAPPAQAQVTYTQAGELLRLGEFREAVEAYDELLDMNPDSREALFMKGLALSNLGDHRESLTHFYQVYQRDRLDVRALVGIGVGLGNLGEYHESKIYLELAVAEDPDDIVAKNYLAFVNHVLARYPYTPTEKPAALGGENRVWIPQWIKPLAEWWAGGRISDSEFAAALEFLISENAIKVRDIVIPRGQAAEIPNWIKRDASLWAVGTIQDDDFTDTIIYMLAEGILRPTSGSDPKISTDIDGAELAAFENYIFKISVNAAKEKRYIEYPNPSDDVIKLFLRDSSRWDFEQESEGTAEKFPPPSRSVIDDTVVLKYKIFVNDQPKGLPLDHVGSLKKSFAFWEEAELRGMGRDVKVIFETTTKKHEANVWVTWVVRDLGEGVLGHAHIGRGIVEVALGDYSCDGRFQLYDVTTIRQIMTHELGHSIGLRHSDDLDSVMYPTMYIQYAYCLLA